MTTIRKQIIDLLEQSDHDVREISQLLGISEKNVNAHFPHIEKTVSSMGKKLVVIPSSCMACGYRFKDRSRHARPGKCPKCKSERIRKPRFTVG